MHAYSVNKTKGMFNENPMLPTQASTTVKVAGDAGKKP